MYLKIGFLTFTFFSLSLLGAVPTKTNDKNTEQMHYTEIKDKKEHDDISKKTGKHIIEYYTPWCGACNNMKPIYNEAAKSHKNRVNFYAVNVDNLKDVAKDKKIQAVPTIAFVKDGKEVLRERGGITKAELNDDVNNFIANKLETPE